MKIEKLACPSCSAPLSGDFAPNQRIECDHCGTPLLLTHVETDSPIFCPGCNTLNSDAVRFCAHCGHELKEMCILCHHQNRIDTRFCARCGANINQAKARRRSLHETNQRRRRERLKNLKAKEARQKQQKLEALLAALDEPENHEFAIFQINQMGTEAVDALVETLLHDTDVDARYGSARALGQIMATQEVKILSRARTVTVRALVRALNDPDVAVQYWAAEALGQCKSNLAIDPLANLLSHPHQGVRQVARQSLQRIGGQRVAQILEKANKRSWRPF